MKQPKIAFVIRNPEILKNISKPSFDICMAALMQNGMVLDHVPVSYFTSEEYYRMCLAAVQQNLESIKFIHREHLTWYSWNLIIMTAVKKDGLALRWIKEQNPEICLEAVKQNHKALVYVDKAMCNAVSPFCYELLQKAAVEKSSIKESGAEFFLPPPIKQKKQKKQKENIIDAKIDLLNAERQTEELCFKAVQQDGLQIQYSWKQTRKLCFTAVMQNPDANIFIRDSDFIDNNDIFEFIGNGFGELSSSILDLAYYSILTSIKKIPKLLKNSEKQEQHQYYIQCKKAIADNPCNIKFIKPALLSDKQYRILCIKAIKHMPQVLEFINKAEISPALYFAICMEMINKVKLINIEKCFARIRNDLLTREQYYELIKTAIDLFSQKESYFNIDFIDIKMLGNNYYYKICRKLMVENKLIFTEINCQFLTKPQYRYLCFFAVKQKLYLINRVDRHRLGNENWLELCRMVIRKEGHFINHIDAITPELRDLALKHGSGLKYVKKQVYTQCLTVLKKKGAELKYIRPNQFTNDQYYKICRTAVEQDAHSLVFVEEMSLNSDQYGDICKIAIKSFPGTIRFINPDKIQPDIYNSWCHIAIKYESHFLEYIPFIDQYFELCLNTVKKDKKTLEFVKYLRLSPKQYGKICRAAPKEEHL